MTLLLKYRIMLIIIGLLRDCILLKIQNKPSSSNMAPYLLPAECSKLGDVYPISVGPDTKLASS